MFVGLSWLVAVCSLLVKLHEVQWGVVKRRKCFYVVTCCVDLLGQPSLQALRAETMVERFTARMHVENDVIRNSDRIVLSAGASISFF